MNKIAVGFAIALCGQFAHADVDAGNKQCSFVFNAIIECTRELRDAAQEMNQSQQASQLTDQIVQLESAAGKLKSAWQQAKPEKREVAVVECNKLAGDPGTQQKLQKMLTQITMLRMNQGGAKRCEVAYARYVNGR